MAKGQRRGNRESRKPKQKKKESIMAPDVSIKGTSPLTGIPKKKSSGTRA